MKSITKNLLTVACIGVGLVGLSACSPEVGSEKWCQEMKQKDKVTWTAEEVAEFTKSCVQ